MIIDRRSLLMTGTFGLAAFSMPGFVRAATVALARGFTHAVASGEPAADSMLLWTRYVPVDGGPVKLRAEISESEDFARIVAGGAQISGPWRDHIAKITVEGLAPGRHYFYRFIAPDGSFSPVGRTKTLPEGKVAEYRAAIFSCANMPFGYFNAYAHAAARDDFDLSVHLGDYLYEYQSGTYPAKTNIVPGREHQPVNELIHLADYRLRYASYRADPDLQRLHQMMPMIALADDHDYANNSWEGGAGNHDTETEGPWNARKAAAIQARNEWLPISDEPWKAYDIGTLATLFRVDTRVEGRTEQHDLDTLFKGADPARAIAAFRDGPYSDAAASILGSQQEDWLYHAVARSVRTGQRWQVMGSGTIVGERAAPPEAANWLAADAPAHNRLAMQRKIALSQAGISASVDTWSGYPAARERLLRAAQHSEANFIVISGDSHNAWAYDLAQDGLPAGVEFSGQSVSSPGFEHNAAVAPDVVERGQIAANPELKWCDSSHRGYFTMTLTPDRATADWVMLDTILTRSTKTVAGHRLSVAHGRNRMG